MKRLLIAALLSSSVACTEAGRLRLRVLWPDQGTAPSQVYLRSEIRLGGGGSTQGGTIGPIDFGTDANIAISAVPHGEGHVAALEVTDDPNAERVLFYGLSEPFALRAGETTDVAVPLELVRPPQIGTGTAAVALADGRTRVNTPDVRLRLRADTGRLAEISNLAGFVSDVVTVDLGSAETVGDNEYIIDWNLDRGLDDPCVEEDFCPREVFVRFQDAEGFRSGAASTTVVLDTRRPEIIGAAVRYLPSDDSVLARIERASRGTEIFVTLNFSEPVEAPSLMATNGVGTLMFTPTGPNGDAVTSLELSAVVESRHSDGVYVPVAVITDFAGNQNDTATFATPTIEVDANPGQLVIRQDQVSFVRAAVQSGAPEPLPGGYTIPAGPTYYALAPADSLDAAEALEANTFEINGGVAPSLLRLWADAGRTQLLETVRPRDDGTWHRDDLRLPNIDIPQVFVSAVDSAGNETAAVGVETTWFVSASGESSLGERPNTVRAATFEPAPVSTTGGYDVRTAAADGDSLTIGASHRWAPVMQQTADPRPGHWIVYDSGRDRVVLIEPSFNDEVWEFDGRTWRAVVPQSARPEPRVAFGLAYDSHRGLTYLWGGRRDGELELLNDLWAWDGERWTEVETSTRPPPRNSHSFVYDSLRRRLVMFGGDASTSTVPASLDDLWEFDGDDWAQVDAGSLRPEPRLAACMTYDSVRGVSLLFGGTTTSTTYRDTWAWDGMRWTLSSTTGPSARFNCGMGFDAARGVAVMHVGAQLRGPSTPAMLADDTWEWDGTRWTEAPNGGGTGVDLVGINALAFDTRRARIVHFTATFMGVFSTWTWDGTDWTALRPSAPSAIDDIRVAWDAARGEAVLFGAFSPVPGLLFPGTALYDGEGWRSLPPGPGPSGRSGHAMAYDPVRERVVLFGGAASGQRLADVWEWDGSAWTPVPTSTVTGPSGRNNHAMAWDPNTQEILMYGGTVDVVQRPIVPGFPPIPHLVNSDETWSWNGQRWLDRTAGARPPHRYHHAMATDVARARVVLHAGDIGTDCFVCGADADGDTWEWDGTSWTEMSPATVPRGRSRIGFTYDPVRAKIVAFGGNDPGPAVSLRNDLWEWDGIDWRDVTPPINNPPGRTIPAMFYDDRRQILTLFGGVLFPDPGRDLWYLEPPARPSIQLAAQLPDDVPPDAWQDLRVRANCGGRGEAGIGARLLGWQTRHPAGVYETLAVNGADVDAAPNETLIDVSLPDAAGFVGPGNRMYFRCISDETAGTGSATVALDYLEIRASYRRSAEP